MNIKNYLAMEHLFWSSICQQHRVISPTTDCYLTPLDLPIFNFIYLRDANQQADLEQAEGIFAEKNKPYCLVIKETENSPLLAAIGQQNYVDDGQTTAMGLSLADWKMEPILITNNPILLVNDRLALWAEPLKTAFPVDEEDDGTIIEEYISYHAHALANNSQMYHFVLMAEDTPATSLTLTLNNKSARLDDIGTNIEFQKRGYATALLAHALNFCKSKHIEDCYLEASSDGLGLYQKQGFSPLFNYRAYLKAS